jgi:hypothetical protein
MAMSYWLTVRWLRQRSQQFVINAIDVRCHIELSFQTCQRKYQCIHERRKLSCSIYDC